MAPFYSATLVYFYSALDRNVIAEMFHFKIWPEDFVLCLPL